MPPFITMISGGFMTRTLVSRQLLISIMCPLLFLFGCGGGSSKTAATPPASVASFAGVYSGSYSGADSGTVSVTLATNGSITGSGISVDSTTFNISGQVAADGKVSLQGSGTAGTATFTGTVTSQGVLAGTWSSHGVSGGSFTTTRSTTTTPVSSYAGVYSGSYSGADSGTVTVTLATNGSITGSGISVDSTTFNISGQVAADGKVSLQGSGTAGTATFTGTVTLQGTLAGTWSSNGVSGGTFTTTRSTTTTSTPGKISVSVKDAVLGSVLAGVNIVVTSGGQQVVTGLTETDGSLLLSVNPGSNYVVTFTKSGFQSNTYSNVAVVSNTTKFLATVLQIDNLHTGNGTVSGKIINALTGANISGAAIKLYSGINSNPGATAIASGTTDSLGAYSIANVPTGNYTAEVSATGYSTAFFTITSIGGTTRSDQNYTLTPAVPAGQTRIVLTWGASPSDLDSHLTGPNGTGRFHVYYAARTATGANLDRDDVGSFGPETATITSQVSGVYRYSVHDFTNSDLTSSSALAGSSAKVQVLRGSTVVAEFNVPGNQAGTLWTVFEMNGDTITPINTLSYNTSGGSTVTKQSLEQMNGLDAINTGTDADLLINLPRK